MVRLFLLNLLIGLSCSTYAALFTLTSSAFGDNGLIPSVYTCDGANNPPPLSWQNIPVNTQSLVLVVQDPNAPSGSWTHWIVYNIDPTVNKLESNVLPEGAVVAQNSWGNTHYQGPCPPVGAHQYVFTLYALDTIISLNNNPTTENALDAFTGHVIGNAVLVGLYQKAVPAKN